MRRFHAQLSFVVALLASTTALIAIPTTSALAAEETLVYEWEVGPLTTNWHFVADFPQFDPAFGNLSGISIELESSVDASMQVENLSPSSACDATLSWGAVIDLGESPSLLNLSLTAFEAVHLEAFDGDEDFGGDSGATFTGLTMSGSDALELTGVDMDPFVGTGTIGLDVIANAAAGVTGCGSIQELFKTKVDADVTLEYRYEANPAIDIEKATNGEDADEPTGPEVMVGDPIDWTYVVTNTGDVDLSGIVVVDDQGVAVDCPKDSLAVDESMTCTGGGIAEAGQYANVGSVTGSAPDGTLVTDADPSHYLGIEPPPTFPAIDIEKATNGEDADEPTGPEIPVGDPVEWTYVVTNTGDVVLTNVSVVDDQGVTVTCPQDTLAVDESMTCTGLGTASSGQYSNLGSVTGEAPGGSVVADEDASHYFGVVPPPLEPAIDIEKATNGEDADTPTGPEILVGDPVEWTYAVTNTGEVPLTNVVVVDDQGVAVSCPKTALAVGESMLCTGVGIAAAGQYSNLGSVTGEASSGAVVSDEDASHYFGVVPPPLVPAIDIEKATNGEDADVPTGPQIPVGDPVEWTYVVTNTGDVPLTNVSVVDDQGVAVTCPQAILGVGVSMTCTGSGIAVAGQYGNVGSVTGEAPGGSVVDDQDASHYFGLEPGGDAPAIDIEKATNGEDADEPTGPPILVGDPVEWTYVVTNTGSVLLTNVSVVDDQGVVVTCPQDILGVGMSMTCTASGIARIGQYSNIGSVTGEAPDGTIVSDEDASHYYGSMVAWWLKCNHGDNGCLGLRGEAPADVVVLVDGEPLTCDVRTNDSGAVRFNCMLDGSGHPSTVTIEVYVGGELIWTGTDLPTVCTITSVRGDGGRPRR